MKKIFTFRSYTYQVEFWPEQPTKPFVVELLGHSDAGTLHDFIDRVVIPNALKEIPDEEEDV